MIVNIVSNEKLNYETQGACAFDFKASETYCINPWEMVVVDTGTVIQVPSGYMLQTASRSSTFKKLWLILVNAVWYIDQDYHWPTDTIKFQYLNLSWEQVWINYWDRIGQGVFLKMERADFHYCDKIKDEDRGGIGSTWLN